METFAQLENQLNDFNPARRVKALEALSRRGEPRPAEQQAVNLHCHTFFSFNAYGYSPSGLAWLARQRGFKVTGIVDFDVLDGVDEFLSACETLGVRGTTGMETRVYLPEFSTRETNSPGEPGVYYHMGVGFTSSQAPAAAAPILAGMRRRADQRNRQMIEVLNVHLNPIAVDYERDVLPLAPSGNATERHMLTAYIRAVAARFPDPVPFWAEKLQMTREQVSGQIGDSAKFQTTVRAKLMKRGGVGYVQPGPDTFPSVDEVNQMVIACNALPCATWLDGLSNGEQAEEELLTLLIPKGIAALNVVPDRNWNVPDPELRRIKIKKLYEVVELARRLDLPLNAGTEMNAPGQKLVDDFDAPELAPVRQAFLDGADFVYGHTVMQRAAGLGYQSEWARTHFPSRHDRNAFYTEIGHRVPPGTGSLEKLKQAGADANPSILLAMKF